MNGQQQRQNRVIEIAAGQRVGVAEFGDPQGVPVFYFHGWPASRLEAAIGDQAARACGVRLIGLDRPGIGLSTPQPQRRIGDWPAVVEAVTAALELPAYRILGLSGGAPYALACAAAGSERLVRVAICCGAVPISGPDSRRLLPFKFRLLLWFDDHWPYPMIQALRFTRWAYQSGPRDAIARAFVITLPEVDRAAFGVGDRVDRVRASIEEAIRQGIDGSVADGRLLSADWGRDLQVPQHIQWWHGTQDSVIPFPLARAFIERHAAIELHVREGEGHFSLPMNHCGEILAALVR